jgi:hypothetical protein
MGSGRIAPSFLTSTIGEVEWPVSRPGRFFPGERALGTHWIGRWVGPKAGLHAVQKRKIWPLL